MYWVPLGVTCIVQVREGLDSNTSGSSKADTIGTKQQTNLHFPIFLHKMPHRKSKCYMEWLEKILFFNIYLLNIHTSMAVFTFANEVIALDLALQCWVHPLEFSTADS